MKRINFLIISLIGVSSALNIFGQSSNNNQGTSPDGSPSVIRIQEAQRRADERLGGKDKNGMIKQPKEESVSKPRLTAEQKEKLEARHIEWQAEYERRNQLLRAPAEYYRKYGSFLNNKEAGLARLFIDKNCDEGKTVSVRELERCAGVIEVKGGGSYYSFRFKNNDGFTKDWWDIHFINDRFVVGNESVQGIISEIGDVDLSNINLKSKELDFLSDYKPKKSLAEIKEQNIVLEKGISFNGFSYSNSVPVKLNSTYVLRSIAYRLKEKTRYDYLDIRVDATLIFKVVGREKDGSVVILWKGLKTDLPLRRLE